MCVCVLIKQLQPSTTPKKSCIQTTRALVFILYIYVYNFIGISSLSLSPQSSMNHALIDVLKYPLFVDKHGKAGCVKSSSSSATTTTQEATHKWSLRGESDVVLADIVTGDQMTALFKYPKFANAKFPIEPMCFHNQKPVKPTDVTADMRASALAAKKPITLTASIPCVSAQNSQLSVQMQLIQEDIIASVPVAMAIHPTMIKQLTPPQRPELSMHVTPAFAFNQAKAMDVGYMDLDVNSDLVTITTPTRDCNGRLWYSSSEEDVVRCYPAGIDIEAYFTFVFRKVKSTGNVKTSGLRMRARQVIVHPMADEFGDIFVGETTKSTTAATTADTVLNDEQTQSELDAIAIAVVSAQQPESTPTTVESVVAVAAADDSSTEQQQQQQQSSSSQPQQQQPAKKRVKISHNAPIVNAPPGLFHDE